MKIVKGFCLIIGIIIFTVCSSNYLDAKKTEITAIGIIKKQGIKQFAKSEKLEERIKENLKGIGFNV